MDAGILIPTRRVGMPSRRAAPRVTGNVAYTGRSASSPAFPRSTWERGVLEHLCIKTSGSDLGIQFATLSVAGRWSVCHGVPTPERGNDK